MIRMRAGTEMLQKAEEIIMYINVENYLCKDMYISAIDAVNIYDTYYHLLPYIPMEYISLDEIKMIKQEELKSLSWIYIRMLETLCSKDAETEATINTMIKESYVPNWSISLVKGITNKYAFSYTHTKWHYDNPWIGAFNPWSGRISYNTPVCTVTEGSVKRMRIE